MSSSEKFSLKWNDFEKNIANSFHGLRDDNNFTNVTLACRDKKTNRGTQSDSCCLQLIFQGFIDW